MRRYVARRLGPSLADDIVSDTFLAAFRRRHRYDPSHPDAAALAVRHRRPAHQPASASAGNAFGLSACSGLPQ
ncbi:sigma factor [Nonomuraea sp. NPDC049141]|uniref:sigma factor n=1 Tax=unclassified Nonomuraea TaxID=2593643 RepID=UPI0033DAF9AD